MAAASKTQIVLAWIVVVVVLALIVLGFVWYGLSAEVHHRKWNDIFGRAGGPMTFRFILQPTMAALAALHDGIDDARTGRPPYLWNLLTNPADRARSLRESVISTARIILLGIVMDGIYQYTVLKTFYPGEMALIALLLAFVPYVLLRGPFGDIARWWIARKSVGSAR